MFEKLFTSPKAVDRYSGGTTSKSGFVILRIAPRKGAPGVLSV